MSEPENRTHKPFYPKSQSGLYKVRLFDGMDFMWMDITQGIAEEEAIKVWNERTENGTRNTHFKHIDYYAIFPSDTVMMYSTDAGKPTEGDWNPWS